MTTPAPRPCAENVRWVTEEVLNQRVGDQPLIDHVQDYIREFTKNSQAIHEMVHAAVLKAQANVQGGDAVTERDIEKAVFQFAVKEVFGEDALAVLLAKVVAKGEFLY